MKPIRWALVAVAALACYSAQAAEPSVAREFGNEWALLIHEGDPGQAELASLAATLSGRFGYQPGRIIRLTGGEASQGAFRDAMGYVYEEFKPGDRLFLHLSLPVRREEGNVFFWVSDSEADAPWTWLELREIIDWMSALPVGGALMTIPSCSDGGPRQYSEPMEYLWDGLRYAKAPGGYEVLHVCDFEALREMREGPALVPSAERRAVVTASVTAALNALADAGERGIAAGSLAAYLSETDSGLRLTTSRYPEYAEQTFAFLPRPSEVDPYRQRYLAAGDVKARQAALLSLTAAAEKQPELSVAAAAFLRTVAMDPMAALGPDSGGPQERMALRTLAVDALGRLARTDETARGAVRELAASGSDPDVRRSAVQAISGLPEPSGEDRASVRARLADPDAGVRAAAVGASILIRDEGSAAAITALAADGDEPPEVRNAALRALSVLPSDESASAAIKALDADDEGVRRAAATALGRLGRSSLATESLLARLQLEDEALVRASLIYALEKTWTDELREPVTDALVQRMSSAWAAEAEAAAYSAGRVGGGAAETGLRRLLANEEASTDVRIAAAESLGKLGSTAALPELSQSLSARSPGLRRATVSALGQIGTPAAADMVLQALNDEDPYVQGAAQQAIAALDVSPADFLGGLADPSPRVRAETLKKLGDNPDPDYLPRITPLLGDPVIEVREIAVDVFAAFDPGQALVYLTRVLGDGDPISRLGAVQAASRMDTARATPLLMRATRDRDATVRAAAAAGLSGRDGAMDPLLSMTGDRDLRVRVEAIKALRPWAQDPSVQERLQALATGREASAVREAAIQVLSATPEYRRKK